MVNKLTDKCKTIETVSILFFILSLILICLSFVNKNIFGSYLHTLTREIPNFLFCSGWALMGLSVRGFLKKQEYDVKNGLDSNEKEKNNYPIRYICYLITLVFVNLLVFLTLYINKLTQRSVFNLLALPIFFLIGFYAFLLEQKLNK